MMKDKTPTTKALLVFSWLIAVLGLIIGGYLIIFRFKEVNLIITGASILLGGLFLATAMRMLGNIGQMFFDLKAFMMNDFYKTLSYEAKETRSVFKQSLFSLNQDLNSRLREISEYLQSFNKELTTQLQNLNQHLQSLNQDLKNQLQNCNADLKSHLHNFNQDLRTQLLSITANCEQINCDAKDINQNIDQIKTFFEQIEKHLNLKK